MSSSAEPILELKKVEKQVRGPFGCLRILKGIDLIVPRGQFLAVTGPSGSGKTTLLEILGCLSRPSSGDYLLGGRSVAKASSNELADLRASSIGFVFQSFNLLARLTARQNVELPLAYQGVPTAERQARALDALSAVGLESRADHPTPAMSGGERQRVAIARAIVGRPPLLLADEPTGNLDAANGAQILQLLSSLPVGRRTLIMVTHDPQVAARADRIMELRDGEFVAERCE